MHLCTISSSRYTLMIPAQNGYMCGYRILFGRGGLYYTIQQIIMNILVILEIFGNFEQISHIFANICVQNRQVE